MKLFLKRDTSADNRLFVVFDEFAVEKYYVYSQNANSNSSIYIKNSTEDVICKIKQIRIVSATSFVFKYGMRKVTLICVPFNNEIKCRYYGTNYHLMGELITKNYSIVDVDNTIIATCKNNISDYELEVFDCANEILALSTSVCLNMINTVDNRAVQAI